MGLILLSLALGTTLLWANRPFAPLPAGTRADRVLVDKSDRELVLLAGGRVLRRYPNSLGAEPRGHQEGEGDERTPEGLYLLDARNSDSAFHLSLHASDPDADDHRRAAAAGLDPGGIVKVHGLPDAFPFLGRLHRLVDWTDGCIAVTNPEIEQIWAVVPDGTAIEIRP